VAAALAVVAMSSAVLAQDFQVGARAKGMGGSYTAFDDDPVSVWLNPAGTATQPLQIAIDYQTFTSYEPKDTNDNDFGRGHAKMNWTDPAILPSFLGIVVPIGSADAPLTVGFAYIRPMQLTMVYGSTGNFGDGDALEDQQFSRFRLSVAYDFRIAKEGFLTHVSVGAGVDMAISRWFETFTPGAPPTGGALGDFTTRATSIGVGFGIGTLIGLYDNGEDLKINVGVAYQSRVDFNWEIDRSLFPVYNWPGMTNAGITVYLLKGMPLRVTVDGQWIDWKHACTPADPGYLGFARSMRGVSNLSVGTEYRINVKEDGSMSVSPRLGYRHVENMWTTTDPTRMPAVGISQLAIESKGTAFHIFTFGGGLTWTSADGKARSIDVGVEINGDSPNFGFGYTHEF